MLNTHIRMGKNIDLFETNIKKNLTYKKTEDKKKSKLQ